MAEHHLTYVELDEQGYGDGLDDVYLCSCGEKFQANGGVPEAFAHGFVAAIDNARKPLVIVGVDGGLVQWEVMKSGFGKPRLHILDYDREGQGGLDLLEFAEEIEEARAALAEYGDAEDDAALLNMMKSINEYERMAQTDETAGRYR